MPSDIDVAILVATAVLAPTTQSRAQQAQSSPDESVVVIGEGSVSVAPNYAQITSSVTTRAKTVKEANDANSKLMAAITRALLEAGITQTDIQTSQFSVRPVYAPQDTMRSRNLTVSASPTRSGSRLIGLGKSARSGSSRCNWGDRHGKRCISGLPIHQKRSTRPVRPLSPMHAARPKSTRRHRACGLDGFFGSPRIPDFLRPLRCGRRAQGPPCRLQYRSPLARTHCERGSPLALKSPIEREPDPRLTIRRIGQNKLMDISGVANPLQRFKHSIQKLQPLGNGHGNCAAQISIQTYLHRERRHC